LEIKKKICSNRSQRRRSNRVHPEVLILDSSYSGTALHRIYNIQKTTQVLRIVYNRDNKQTKESIKITICVICSLSRKLLRKLAKQRDESPTYLHVPWIIIVRPTLPDVVLLLFSMLTTTVITNIHCCHCLLQVYSPVKMRIKLDATSCV
jgi:hypothetical protein